ncbi:MAG: phospholipase domain-containing protein [Candidatus Bipolaricaulota bacterium]
MGQRNTRSVRILVQVAAGVLVLAVLAGCGRVGAKITTWVPDNPAAPAQVEAGKTTTLSLTFTNTGNRTGTFVAQAVVKDSQGVKVGEDPKTVTVDPGKSHTVTWEHLVRSPGTYTVVFTVGKDATTTFAQQPAEPQRLIVGLPPVASTEFRSGDRVRATQMVNVRTGPGTSNPEISHVNYREHAAIGTQGKIIGGPDKAGDYVWWRVEFDVGYTGWCIETALAKATDK